VVLTQTNHSVRYTDDLGVLDAASESGVDKTWSVHDSLATSTQPLYNHSSYTETLPAVTIISSSSSILTIIIIIIIHPL